MDVVLIYFSQTDNTRKVTNVMADACRELGSGFYDLMGWIIMDKVLRFMMPEPRPDADKCDLCYWCVTDCPMHNITLEKVPILGDRCIRCYHCMIGCPQRAYDADWRFADPFLMFIYNPRFMRWFGDLKPGDQIN
jgi:ferredoxin